MRKKIASSIIAASLTIAAVPAIAPATATAQTNFAAGDRAKADTGAVGRGIEKAFDPNESSSIPEGSGFKGFMKMIFEPYKQMFNSNLETSSQGVTRTIINYVIIAAGVTVIGQAIQMVMANMPR